MCLDGKYQSACQALASVEPQSFLYLAVFLFLFHSVFNVKTRYIIGVVGSSGVLFASLGDIKVKIR